MITKSPVTKFKPWIYAVLCSLIESCGLSSKKKKATHPRPSFPARGFRTYRPFLRHTRKSREYSIFYSQFYPRHTPLPTVSQFPAFHPGYCHRPQWPPIQSDYVKWELAFHLSLCRRQAKKKPTFPWTSWPTTRQWLADSCARCMLEEWHCTCGCRRSGTFPAYCVIRHFRTGSWKGFSSDHFKLHRSWVTWILSYILSWKIR